MDKGKKKKIDKTVKKNNKINKKNSQNTIQYPVNQNNVPEKKMPKASLQKKAQKNKTVKKNSRKAIRRQRTMHIVTTVTLIAILLAICIFISLKVLFVVRKVDVIGSEKYTPDEVLAYCAIPMEENIFNIDTKTLEEQLPKEFTYIENAKVQRKLPDKILITIEDSIPTYYSEEISDDEIKTYRIYSQNFKLLTAQASPSEGLINISANLENESEKELIFKMLDKLNANGYDRVTALKIDENADISFVYDGRIEVKLGSFLDVDYKLKMTYHVLNNELTDTDKGVIDSTQAGSAIFKPQY